MLKKIKSFIEGATKLNKNLNGECVVLPLPGMHLKQHAQLQKGKINLLEFLK